MKEFRQTSILTKFSSSVKSFIVTSGKSPFVSGEWVFFCDKSVIFNLLLLLLNNQVYYLTQEIMNEKYIIESEKCC